MDLSELFNDFRASHKTLMDGLDKVCRKAITEYNKNERNHTKIEKCRIKTSQWHPDQKTGIIDFQIWIVGGWPKMYSEQVEEINDTFKKILDKYLPHKKGFGSTLYIQNVTIDSYDD